MSFAVVSTTYPPRLQAWLTKHSIEPHTAWENVHQENIKPSIYRTFAPLAGVYVIINLNNGKSYVGSAIPGQLYSRFHKHLFGASGSKLVKHVVLKQGLENLASFAGTP